MNEIQSSRKKFNGTVFVLMALFGIVAVATIILFTRLTTTSAAPGDLASAEGRYPAMVGSRIDTCSLCHLGSPPTLNTYGADYKAHGRNAAAIAAIESLDSDGDGFNNLHEIQALSFPGNGNDIPAAARSTLPNTSNAYPPPATETLPAYPPPATSVPTQAPTASATPTSTTTPSRTTAPTRRPTNTTVPTQAPSSTAAPTEGPTSTTEPTQTATSTVTSTPENTSTPEPTQAATSTVAPTQEATSTPEPTQAATSTVAPTQENTNTSVPTLAATKSRLRPTRTPTAVKTRRPTRTPTAVKTRRPTSTPRPTREASPTPTCGGRRGDNARDGCRTPRPTRTLGPLPTGFCDFLDNKNCDDFNQRLGGFNGVSFGNLDLFFVPFKELTGAYNGGTAGK
jgi:hypothetical protein